MTLVGKKIKQLALQHPRFFNLKTLQIINHKGQEFEQISFEIIHPEAAQESLPRLILIGGVHGLEVIGTKVLVSFLEHLLEQLNWNDTLANQFKRVAVVGIPIVNPVGFENGTRCNGNGVDLMRSAPVQSEHSVVFFGGQTFTPKLPYFMGYDTPELETQSVFNFVEGMMSRSPFSLLVDIHSGFGFKDSLWTPYAQNTTIPLHWPHYERLKSIINATLRHNVYVIEKQSDSYCTHGDIWDHMYDISLRKAFHFLPLTLELGSWTWIKKSPSSVLNVKHLFNPSKQHREKRVLRRHIPLFNVLLNIVASYKTVFAELPINLHQSSEKS